MAGLLDFLEQGDNPLGLALLAAGGPTTDPNRSGFGQRIAGAVGQAQAQRQAARERQMMEEWRASQIAENASQAELRRAQIAEAERKAALFGGFAARLGGGAGQPLGAGGGSAGGAPGAPGAPVSRGTGGGLASFTPDELALAQLAGLPNLTEQYKLTRPDMVDAGGGYFVDKRQIQPGVNPEVQAAIEAQERMKGRVADSSRRVEVIGPDGRKRSVLVGETGGGGAAPAPSSRPPVIGTFGRGAAGAPGGPAGPYGADGPLDVLSQEFPKALQEEQRATAAGDAAAAARAREDAAGIARELRRLPGGAQRLAQLSGGAAAPGGIPAAPVPTPTPPLIGGRPPAAAPAAPASAPGELITDFSPAEKLQQEADKARTLKQIERELDEAAAPGKSARAVKEFEEKERVKVKVEQEALAPKKAEQLRDSIEKADRIMNKVDQALEGTGVSTAGLGGLTASLPMTPARDLRGTLDTIKANLGFAELAAMRAASPTGGALGNVAVKELDALQATISSLDQLQSPGKLRSNLEEVRTRYANWKKAVQAAQKEQGGANKPAKFEALPPASQFKGKTARDTATGKRFRSDGLDWKPVE